MELKYGDKIIRMEGVIVEVHDGCVGVDLKGRLGFLKIPMRMLITDYPIKVGQEVAWNMSFVEQMGPEIKKAYSASLLSLAAGRRLWRGTPLAFGESDVKIRIKNVLRYQKPAFWLVLLAAAVLIAAVAGLCTDQRQAEPDLSFLDPDNLIATLVEQPEVQINPYKWDSYVYVSGQQIAGWIDETQWQRLKTPPEKLPQITYSLEYL